MQLLRAVGQCDEKAAVRRRRRRRTRSADVEQRATRAEMLIQLGELSSAREALEGCEIGTRNHSDVGCVGGRETSPSVATRPLLMM